MLLSSEKMFVLCYPENQSFYRLTMLRRKDSNLRPLGYEPSELPSATTPLCYPYAKLKTTTIIFRTKNAAILTDNGVNEIIMYSKNSSKLCLSESDRYRLRQGFKGCGKCAVLRCIAACDVALNGKCTRQCVAQLK